MTTANPTTRIEEALAALRTPFRPGDQPSFVSDLTVGELILLEEVGYRPVDIVWGAGSASFNPQFTTAGMEADYWGQSIASAIDHARGAIAEMVQRNRAAGVVAMRLEIEREPFNVITCSLIGTAIRPAHESRHPSHLEPFTTTLSARDFHVLVRAGYEAAGIVRGASVVGFAQRSVSQSLGLARDNVELVDQTNALYSAREKAMEAIEREAITLGADGVVALELHERPVSSMLTHAVEFIAIGTAVRKGAGHAAVGSLHPEMQLTLDDAPGVSFKSE